MNIERIDPDQRWSEAVVHNETVYYTSVPENRRRRDRADRQRPRRHRRAAGARRFGQKPHSGCHHLPANTADFAAMNAARTPGGRRQRAGALHGAGAADESEVQGGNQNHRRAVSLSADEKPQTATPAVFIAGYQDSLRITIPVSSSAGQSSLWRSTAGRT